MCVYVYPYLRQQWHSTWIDSVSPFQVCSLSLSLSFFLFRSLVGRVGMWDGFTRNGAKVRGAARSAPPSQRREKKRVGPLSEPIRATVAPPSRIVFSTTSLLQCLVIIPSSNMISTRRFSSAGEEAESTMNGRSRRRACRSRRICPKPEKIVNPPPPPLPSVIVSLSQ
ncbi:hypothetical protein LY76DRAFT_67002 [Colletotrichum caudatum]|nr:hypothetical protein LY76DRAFT_67002 [Colletotrichum caudatum]